MDRGIMTEQAPLIQQRPQFTEDLSENSGPLVSHDSGVPSLDRSSRRYYLGCVYSVLAAIANACAFTTLQVLDDVTGFFQPTFGLFIGTDLLYLCYFLYHRKLPQLPPSCTFAWFIVFVVAEFLMILFSYYASIHIAVGTLNAIALVSFLVLMVAVSIIQEKLLHITVQPLWLILDLSAAAIVSLAVIFLVQPPEIFGNVEYFQGRHEVYTSLCNPHRFDDNITVNVTANSMNEKYQATSWVGYVCAVLVGLTNTLIVASFQKLQQECSPHDVVFYMSAVNAVVSLLAVNFTGGFVFPDKSLCLLSLFASCLCGGLLTVFFYEGMVSISSVDVALISGFVLPILFVFQFTFLRSVSPAPTNAVAVVAAVVVTGVVLGKPLIQGCLAKRDITLR